MSDGYKDEAEAIDQSIGLSSFIRALRREIGDAINEGGGSNVRFKPGTLDLELHFQVERKAKGDAGIKFKIFGTGADIGVAADASRGSHQTLKMRLDVVIDPKLDNLINSFSEKPNV